MHAVASLPSTAPAPLPRTRDTRPAVPPTLAPVSSMSRSSRSSTSRLSSPIGAAGLATARLVGMTRSSACAGSSSTSGSAAGRGREVDGAGAALGSWRGGKAGASFWGAGGGATCFAAVPHFSDAAVALAARYSESTSRQLLSAASPRSLFLLSVRSMPSVLASSTLLVIASGPAAEQDATATSHSAQTPTPSATDGDAEHARRALAAWGFSRRVREQRHEGGAGTAAKGRARELHLLVAAR